MSRGSGGSDLQEVKTGSAPRNWEKYAPKRELTCTMAGRIGLGGCISSGEPKRRIKPLHPCSKASNYPDRRAVARLIVWLASAGCWDESRKELVGCVWHVRWRRTWMRSGCMPFWNRTFAKFGLGFLS